MIKEKSVFVIHYPLLDGLTNSADIMDLNQHDERKIKKSTSPIALFVSVKPSETEPYQLKPVAIQLDANSGKNIISELRWSSWKPDLFYSCMERSDAIMYAIAYAILNSMKNLRFDKEGYFHVLVFYGLFYKRNRKHFSCVIVTL